MIFFDVTKVSGQGHQSGLSRVSRRLQAELSLSSNKDIRFVRWKKRHGGFIDASSGRPVRFSKNDWLLTPELFSEEERPGFTAFLARRTWRAAAIFHDAIPLRFPEFTWPKSVTRHPLYMKLLLAFDAVLAVSASAQNELAGYWDWLAPAKTPTLTRIPLGANLTGGGRALPARSRSSSRELLMVGILEPRKNQMAALDACERLWSEGFDFSLSLVGRVNPFFGKPIVKRVRDLKKKGRPVAFEEQLTDDLLIDRLGRARFSLFPSLAEGCGLPVLESLWMGIPCLCSDIAPLRETAEGGGCLTVKSGDTKDLESGIRRLVTDNRLLASLEKEAAGRTLPVWADTAAAIRAALSA